jgi:hypothetical protein
MVYDYCRQAEKYPSLIQVYVDFYFLLASNTIANEKRRDRDPCQKNQILVPERRELWEKSIRAKKNLAPLQQRQVLDQAVLTEMR